MIGGDGQGCCGVDKTFEYDALSRLTRMVGGPITTFTYDDASQLTNLSSTLFGSPVESFTYTYDPLGNRISLTDRLGLHQYSYDALSRLITVDHPTLATPNPLAGLLPDESYAYDPVGNRTTSHLSTSHLHDSANRLLEDDSFFYSYDANGNRIEKRPKTCPLPRSNDLHL